MNLSMANQKRIEGWEVVGMPVSIADMPLLWGYILTREGQYKVLVIKYPTHAVKTNPITPVWYESPSFPTRAKAVADARSNCT